MFKWSNHEQYPRGQQLDHRLNKLTVREKEALRLLLRGFDVKSCARELGVSTNNITERLRNARLKLEVSSSREAARRLQNAEGDHHIFYGHSFSEVEQQHDSRPSTVLPDHQVEARETIPEFRVREAYSGFQMQPELFAPLSNLPLRRPGELRNSLSKKQRFTAIVDLATRLALVIAVICLLALVMNMFAGSR
jgi:DNA-binding CsgD family transcriptional regulator